MTYDTEGTQHDLLREQVDVRPGAPYLTYEGRTRTFGELDAETDRLAAGLQQVGVTKGDVVSIIMSNRPEFIVGSFAISKVGGIQAPINTAHRGTVLKHMLGISKCKAVIVEVQFLSQLIAVLPDLVDLSAVIILGDVAAGGKVSGRETIKFLDLCASGGTLRPVDVKPWDPGKILFTSGTTGFSKGALKPQNETYATAHIYRERMSYSPDERVYVYLPLFHGNALYLASVAALCGGSQVFLVEKFSARNFWSDIRRFGCTATNIQGGIISILMKADPQPNDSDNPLQRIGGGVAPVPILEAFEERFGVILLEGYGLSEMGGPLYSTAHDRKLGTCGKPHSEFEVALLDDFGHRVPDETVGEFVCRPKRPNYMMTEYIGAPEKTVEAFRDLWFHTGDLMIRDADGFYRFVDRKKDAIRRMGENISSFEVEFAVNEHPAVLESAAYAVENEIRDQEVMISVVLKPSMFVTAAELHRHCQDNMAKFMVPRFIRFVESMPKTPTQRNEKYRLKEVGITTDTWDAKAADLKKVS